MKIKMKTLKLFIKDVMLAVTVTLIGFILLQLAKMLYPSVAWLGGICIVLGFAFSASGGLYMFWVWCMNDGMVDRNEKSSN